MSHALAKCEADKRNLEMQLSQAQSQLQEQDDTLESVLHTAQEVPSP